MKNLVILGVPRAGKSTLAKYVVNQMIRDGIPVTLMSGDALIGGLTAQRAGLMWYIFVRPLRHIFPFIKRNSKKSLHDNYRRFITRFFNETSSEFPVVFEGVYITPAQAAKMFDPKRCKIVVVGYPNATPKDKIADIRKFDKNNTAISAQDEAALRKTVMNLIEISKQYEQESMGKFVFLDTSKNYQETLKNFAKNISKFLNE